MPMPVTPLPTVDNALSAIDKCLSTSIGVDTPFAHSIDSATSLSLLLRMQQVSGIGDWLLPPTLLFDRPTPRSLALLISAPVCRH